LEALRLDPTEGDRRHIQDWSFPTDKLRDEFLATIERRTADEIRMLINHLLFDATTFGGDNFQLELLLGAKPSVQKQLMRLPYYQRLVSRTRQRQPMYPGTRWVLDLLPHFPKAAIEVLEAYLLAYSLSLPDGRISGLSDAMAVIRARYIGRPATAEAKRQLLFDISDRDFERLVERLYDAMGYETKLTPPTSDGGRDIIATKGRAGHKDHLRIECKLHKDPVRVGRARELLGVVSDEKVNKGVLVASSRFTRGAVRLAERNPRLELVTGAELVLLMNEHLGAEWPSHLDSFLVQSRRTHL
jgi:restriction system protein